MDNCTFDDLYLDLLDKAYSGVEQYNQRTDTTVHAFFGAAFKWQLDHIPLSDLRPMYTKTAAAEVAWKLSGRKSIKWLQKYTSIWDEFAVDGQVERAYGYRWRHAFGIDQVNNIINKLTNDPSSRQQLLLSWDPREDNVTPALNIPCPWASQYLILDNRLEMVLHVRSNDLLYGFPYDLMMYTLLGQAFANSLDVDLGHMMYTIAHGHIYDNQIPAVEALLDSDTKDSKEYVFRHTFTVHDIIEDPDDFVDHIVELTKGLNYDPKNVTKGLLPKVVV